MLPFKQKLETFGLPHHGPCAQVTQAVFLKACTCKLAGPLQVQTGTVANVPFDKFLACSHLLEERRISDNPSCVLDFTACLIQTSNNADDCTLHDVRQIRYPIE